MSPGVNAVVSELQDAGFRLLGSPLDLGGVEFDFEAALAGTLPSHDLVVVSGEATPLERLVPMLSAVGRRLDHARSTRPVTLVMLGPEPPLHSRRQLEANARLLVVGSSEPHVDEIRTAIAVLLPLDLNSTQDLSAAPLEELRAALGPTVTAYQDELLSAAPFGADAVRDQLKVFIAHAIEGGRK